MNSLKIAILGGTGKEGKGLGYRWALAGHEVIIGSRLKEKAELAAKEISDLSGVQKIVYGLDNLSAAQIADVIVLTVPYSAHAIMCESIKEYVSGKLVVDVTVPLVPPKVSKVQMPPAGSATMEAKLILGDNVRVGSAFQNISYEHLFGSEKILCDVLVTGDLKNTREEIIGLVGDAGLQGWDAGPIENSVVVEGMTSILIGLNKKYGVQSAGIKITGID